MPLRLARDMCLRVLFQPFGEHLDHCEHVSHVCRNHAVFRAEVMPAGCSATDMRRGLIGFDGQGILFPSR